LLHANNINSSRPLIAASVCLPQYTAQKSLPVDISTFNPALIAGCFICLREVEISAQAKARERKTIDRKYTRGIKSRKAEQETQHSSIQKRERTEQAWGSVLDLNETPREPSVCVCVCVALKLSGHETITHLSSQINVAPGWKHRETPFESI